MRHSRKIPPTRIGSIDALLQILDVLPTSLFIKDENLNFVFSNEAHGEIIGSSAELLMGLSDADFYPVEQAEKFMAGDRLVLESNVPKEFLELSTNADGMTSYSLTRKARIVTPDGKTYLVGTNTNVTEMKRKEAELAAKEARYRALAETVPVGIWHLHESGETLYVNPLLLNLLGLTDGEFAANKPATMFSCCAIDDVTKLISEATRFETDLLSDGKAIARAMVVDPPAG